MTAPTQAAGAHTDLSALGQLKDRARARDPDAVREAARQFESLFTRMLLKSMREASFGDPLFESGQQGFYRDLFDDQLAVELSRGKGLGLADMLVEQLRRAGVPSDAAAAASRAGSAWRAESPEQFTRELWPHAQRAARELGVDPQAILAQAALETGWGRALPCDPDGRCSFNLFGIKADGSWTGAAVKSRTREYEGGVAVERQERFRAYGSLAESFDDYVNLLKRSPRYVEALRAGDDTAAFARGLARGGYATDPDYVSKLTAVAARIEAALPAALKNAADPPMLHSGSAG
jgi:flagellar protein FlgJ